MYVVCIFQRCSCRWLVQEETKKHSSSDVQPEVHCQWLKMRHTHSSVPWCTLLASQTLWHLLNACEILYEVKDCLSTSQHFRRSYYNSYELRGRTRTEITELAHNVVLPLGKDIWYAGWNKWLFPPHDQISHRMELDAFSAFSGYLFFFYQFIVYHNWQNQQSSWAGESFVWFLYTSDFHLFPSNSREKSSLLALFFMKESL